MPIKLPDNNLSQSPIETTAGSRIESARQQIGLSAPQLARLVGVKTKTLENWENDRSGPRGDKLTKLAGVLQVPLIWLLTGETPEGHKRAQILPETARVADKLERAIAMQQELAALLFEVSADVSRLQQQLDDEQDRAA